MKYEMCWRSGCNISLLWHQHGTKHFTTRLKAHGLKMSSYSKYTPPLTELTTKWSQKKKEERNVQSESLASYFVAVERMQQEKFCQSVQNSGTLVIYLNCLRKLCLYAWGPSNLKLDNTLSDTFCISLNFTLNKMFKKL